jgi:hypothetical protein
LELVAADPPKSSYVQITNLPNLEDLKILFSENFDDERLDIIYQLPHLSSLEVDSAAVLRIEPVAEGRTNLMNVKIRGAKIGSYNWARKGR